MKKPVKSLLSIILSIIIGAMSAGYVCPVYSYAEQEEIIEEGRLDDLEVEEPVSTEPETEEPETIDGHGLGYIAQPYPVDIPIVGAKEQESGYPLLRESGSYNGYEQGLLPEIRNQGSEGACWAFASLGAVETDLIHDGASLSTDTSELQLAYFTCHKYIDPKGCHNRDNVYYAGYGSWLSNGGCQQMAYRAMMEGVGIVSESDMPYREGYELNGFAPSDEYAYGYNTYQLKGAYVINIDDREGIKSAIREHGGVAVSFYANSTYYNSYYNSYYCNGSGINHAVMLVGWDDNFSKDNFGSYSKPSSNGAWLVRNSWGDEGYGFYGYFWISYEDASLRSGQYAVAFDADTDVYDNTYAYFRNFSQVGPATVYAGQKVKVSFNAEEGESVTAVGFETADADFTAYATVTADGQQATGSVSTHYAGFYVIELTTDIILTEDSEVNIELSFSKNVRLIVEYPGNLYYGSIYLSNAPDGEFYVGNTHYSYDPMVMLYTNDEAGEVIDVENVSLDRNSLNLEVGDTGALSATVTPGNATKKVLVWRSSNTGVAEVDSNGNVKAVGAGDAVITVSSKNGKTATCSVHVTGRPVTGVSLDKENYSLSIGQTGVLNATVYPENAGNKTVHFSSSDPGTVSVDDEGTLTALKSGTVTITVTTDEGGFTDTCTVNVKKGNKKITGLSVSYGSMTGMTVGETRYVDIKVYPEGASAQDLFIQSSDPAVATMDYTGAVKALGLGYTIISISTPDGFSKVSIYAEVSYEGDGGNGDGGNGDPDYDPETSALMYRLYNPNSGEHFYTESKREKDRLVKAGWNYEDIGWIAPKTGDPVYRLYNENAGDHHYTMSGKERDSLIREGWKDEGVGWYSAPADTGTPLYRLYNPNAVAGSHHYTQSLHEVNSLIGVGWNYEGIAWYAF